MLGRNAVHGTPLGDEGDEINGRTTTVTMTGRIGTTTTNHHHHNYHSSTPIHCREQLLTGWKRGATGRGGSLVADSHHNLTRVRRERVGTMTWGRTTTMITAWGDQWEGHHGDLVSLRARRQAFSFCNIVYNYLVNKSLHHSTSDEVLLAS
jgi:hypothetical protein